MEEGDPRDSHWPPVFGELEASQDQSERIRKMFCLGTVKAISCPPQPMGRNQPRYEGSREQAPCREARVAAAAGLSGALLRFFFFLLLRFHALLCLPGFPLVFILPRMLPCMFAA